MSPDSSPLSPADGAVLLAYLLGTTALGLWVGRRSRTVAEYFMPRKFSKPVMVMYAFGTGTASDQAVVVASATFQNGLSGIWYQWLWLFATPFYWMIAPIMRRFRAITTADVYALRFSPGVANLFAVLGIASMAVKIGVLLKGSAVLVEGCTDGRVDGRAAILAMGVLFVAYGTVGGLTSVVLTDFVQGLFTLAFSFMLLPLVLHAVGGMDGVRATVRDPAMLSLVSPGKIGGFFIAMFGLQALVGIVAQPFVMGTCSAGRTEMDGRVGFMGGNFVKRICTVGWAVTGIAALAWYQQRGASPPGGDRDRIYGDLARALLPPVAPGLLGLFVASMLASVMSSCSAYMITSSALFTENLYRPAVRGRSARHYIGVSRAASVLVVAGGLVFAYRLPSLVKGLEIWLSIAPMLGLAFWLGLFWRGMTAAGAWATTLVGFAAWFLATRGASVAWLASQPWADALRLVWAEPGRPPELYEPWRIALYTASAVAAGVAVSLVTKRTDPERLERFYALVKTPARPGEVIERPCTLPAGTVPAHRPMWLTAFGLEIPAPSRTSIAGFAAGWALVGALIGAFVLFVRG
jgi:Na+/proline symporter